MDSSSVQLIHQKELILLVKNIKKTANSHDLDLNYLIKQLRELPSARDAFLQRYSRNRRAEIAMMLPQALDILEGEE